MQEAYQLDLNLGTVPTVFVKFETKHDATPPLLLSMGHRLERKLPPCPVRGYPLIDHDGAWGMVSAADLGFDLLDQGYVLVGAAHCKQPIAKNSDRLIHVSKFLFANPALARPFVLNPVIKGFKENEQALLAEFDSLCQGAIWLPHIYANPAVCESGLTVPGQASLSLKFSHRLPLLDDKGQPNRIWPRDPETKQVNGKPRPVVPNHYMNLRERKIILTPRG